MSRRHWLIGSAVGITCIAGCLRMLAPGIVRSRLEQAAARFDADVTSVDVAFGFREVHLSNLQLTLKSAPHVAVSLDRIDVAVGWSLSPERIDGHGLHVRLRGAVDEVRSEIQQTLSHASHNTTGAVASSKPRPVVRFSESTLRWDGAHPAIGSIEVSGGGLELASNSVVATAQKVAVQSDRGSVAVRGAHIELDGPASLSSLRGLGADAVDLELTASPAREIVSPLPAASASIPVASASTKPSSNRPGKAPPTKAASVGSAKKSGDVLASVLNPPESPSTRDESPRGLAKLTSFAEQARALSLQLAPVLATLPPLGTKALRITVPHEGTSLTFGPSEATLERRGESTAIELAAVPEGNSSKSTPLSLALRIPDRADDAISLDVRGGPVPLSLLIQDPAAFHLVDPAKSTLEVNGSLVLSPDGKELSWTGSASAQGLNIDHKKIASSVVHGLGMRWSGEAKTSLDLRSIKVPHATISSSGVTAEVSGEIERGEGASQIQLKVNVPLASCQAAIDGVPSELIPLLAGAKMTGTFSAHASIRFDSKKPAATDVGLTLLNECRFTSVPPAVDVARFRGPITRRVYHPDGTRYELVTGPGTPTWVPYTGISPFMFAAVQMTEDGAFFRHRGLDIEAIRNSIRENLNEGAFKRGASTISMQTAKNLYLDREKTISRKLQEALLTTYLEQVLTKEQILELYMNNIEFAPNVYGIGPAAAHYFHTYPGALSLGQALYISSILPNPKVQHFGAGGRVSPGWMGLMYKWMKSMYRLHLIEETELNEGLGEYVIFGQPKPERASSGIGIDEVNPPGEPQIFLRIERNPSTLDVKRAVVQIRGWS